LRAYVAVEALVCALLGGKGEGGGTGGQADDVVEGLHGVEIVSGCCGVDVEVFVGFEDDVAVVVVVRCLSAFIRVLIPFVRVCLCTSCRISSQGVLLMSFFAIVTSNGEMLRTER
jgi:hypothetical protein